jgi:hypothetical protein
MADINSDPSQDAAALLGAPSAAAGPPVPYAASPDTTTSSLPNAIQPSQSQQQQAPQPQQQQPPADNFVKAKQHSASILQAVFNVLAGTPTKRFDPNTNTVVPNQLTTGQKVENLIGSGLRGAAAGMSQVGPGSVGRSFLAGQQVEQNRQSAQDKSLNEQVNFATTALNTARAGWMFQRQKQLVHENSVNQYDALDNFLASGKNNKDLGTFPTFADFLKAHPDLQASGTNISNLSARGLAVATIPTDDSGHSMGVHIWQIDPEWKEQQVGAPYVYKEYKGDRGDGPEYQDHTLLESTPNKTVLQFLMGSGYGTLGVPPQTGAKSHDEAVSWVASGSDEQRAAGQNYLNTEKALRKDDALEKLENVPSLLARENAAAAIPQLQNMLTTETDPDKRVRISRLISTAKSAHLGYTQDLQSDANAKQVASQGSPVDAGRLLANGSLTLADLKTRGLTPAFILQATNNAQRFNSSYKPSDEVIAEQVAKSPSANQFFGSANSLIQQGGTLDQLQVIGSKIPQNKIPVLNTLEDWTQVAKGKGPLAGYAATILGVADDYGKVMGGGTASDSARNSALALIGAAQSPEQRAQAINSIRGSVVSQADSRIGTNQFLRRQYGYALPQSTASQPAPQKAPNAQSWSLGAWQRANPNGDPNAAKAAAAQQGYQVIP